jgi:glycoprotein endo-alpha-1,2-mannosidase
VWFLTAATVTAALMTGAAGSRTASPGSPGGGGAGEVAIFYYPWYGTAAVDGSWEHWQQNGNDPPASIASNWFPVRGVYSSSDVAVVRAQMREIASIGVQTVIVSWWGPGSAEAARLPLVERAARAAGLRVALHVEPFAGRTPAALVSQLRALASAGITDVYVYDSTSSPDSEWKAANGQLAGLRLFANTGLPGKAEAGGFAGLYTYDVRIYDGRSFPRMCASARMHNLLCAPSVGPGFDAERATGDLRVQGRGNGKTYDRMWRGAVRAAADVVTITSYNEWHEGTQIEPASAVGGPYSSYDGAYGLEGRAAERAYLDRTAAWVRTYRERVGR